MNDENKKNGFPRIPESNWWSIRKQFKKAMPSSVNASYLKSLLDLGSESAARNLLAPLKAMGLIDDDAKPTARANRWRDDDQYKTVCGEIIKDVYPQELLDLYPDDSNLERKSITKWFMSNKFLGEPAAKMNAAMFIILREGKINDELPMKSPKKEKLIKNNDSKKKRITLKTTEETDKSFLNDTSEKVPQKAVSMHIDLQIHISPEASTEQIDTIFESISRHLYK